MEVSKELIKSASQYKKLVIDIKRIEKADIINEKLLATSLMELLKIRENIKELSSQVEEPLENFPERKLLQEIRKNKDFISKKVIEKIPQLIRRDVDSESNLLNRQ